MDSPKNVERTRTREAEKPSRVPEGHARFCCRRGGRDAAHGKRDQAANAATIGTKSQRTRRPVERLAPQCALLHWTESAPTSQTRTASRALSKKERGP